MQMKNKYKMLFWSGFPLSENGGRVKSAVVMSIQLKTQRWDQSHSAPMPRKRAVSTILLLETQTHAKCVKNQIMCAESHNAGPQEGVLHARGRPPMLSALWHQAPG